MCLPHAWEKDLTGLDGPWRGKSQAKVKGEPKTAWFQISRIGAKLK